MNENEEAGTYITQQWKVKNASNSSLQLTSYHPFRRGMGVYIKIYILINLK